MDCSLDSDYICLLTNDGSETAIKLAQSLTAEEWKVVLLSFPQSIVPQQLPLSRAINSVTLADMSEKHLQQQLETIIDRYGKIGAFIHLSPINLDNTKAKAILKSVFLLAKHLKQSLNEAATRGRSWFITVSRLDGKLGLGNNGDFEVISGGLFGLAKTLNWEWQPVFCRSLDLSPKLDVETAVNSILSELYDPNISVAEAGYSSQGRVTLVGEDYPPALTAANIDRDSVFLVSGGGRGITAQCVIKLSKYYRCKFILLGRSQLKLEPDWANNYTEEREFKKRAFSALSKQGIKPQPKEINQLIKGILATREIKQTLQEIEELGSTAIYISVDLTDDVNLQEKLNPVINKLGQITGIIHGAGVLADKLIEYKTEQDFERVYTTKIAGLQNLLTCVNLQQIKHLILFSSAAGFYGNIGQADYAIANEILNKFAYQFKHQYSQCRVVAFNWGPWSSGMVTSELKKVFSQRGITVIPVDIGTKIFVDEIVRGKSVQVLVGSSLVNPVSSRSSDLKSYRIRRKLTLKNNPILQEHVIGDRVVLPATFAIAWFADTAEKLYPDYHFFSCQNYKVLKGIVFDYSLAEEYILDIKEIRKEENFNIELSVLIWRENNSRTRYNYQAEIKLIRDKLPAPNYNNFELISEEKPIDIFPYRDKILFHGERIQGIKKILKIAPNKLILECKLPSIEDSDLGQFANRSFNAIAADIQFQCLLLWARYYSNGAGLPSFCRYGEHYSDIPAGETFYVSLEVKSQSATKLVADVISHDKSGKIYTRIQDAEMTISKQLDRLLQKRDEQINPALFPSFWRKYVGVRHPVGESLYLGLYDRFVGNIDLEDSPGFYALEGRPRIYLANHQVAIESSLFIYAVSTLSYSVINAVAKIEHQHSWMSELSRQLYVYPQARDPELNFYFDRQDRGSMLELLAKIKQAIEERGNSLLVHVAGTRSLSFRQPIKDVSAVFIDLAIKLNIPLIPVKFVGGLPVKPLTTRLEFPFRYTHQDYYLGKAIHPQTLQSLGNLERKELILQQLNSLGVDTKHPLSIPSHNDNDNFEQEVKLWREKTGVSEVRAVFYKILEKTINPPQEVSTLVTGIQQGNLHFNDTPEGNWLRKFGEWLTGG